MHTLQAEVTFLNPGGNYLGVGDQPLPLVYAVLAAAFLVAFLTWVTLTRLHVRSMHKSHHLMTLLTAVKVASLACEAAKFQAIAVTGHDTGTVGQEGRRPGHSGVAGRGM